jgi:hypothetical protein
MSPIKSPVCVVGGGGMRRCQDTFSVRSSPLSARITSPSRSLQGGWGGVEVSDCRRRWG